jgi:phosphoenolpyruvate carboxylase
MVRIPRCMSTQHPDNVSIPFFSSTQRIGGEDEVKEAYYAYSHLGCDEQMWDYEGKEVDNFVVKKLLTRYEGYFKEKRLGKDLFLTLRVPNPTVEKAEAKILLETLESIPRSFDAAKLFYKDDLAPIFEVILPMTMSHRCLDRIYRYYTDFIIERQHKRFKDEDISIFEWIGEFKPDKINVIPLVEDINQMLVVHEIVGEYIKDKQVDHQRVFLARSDPAMNYGIISAVLVNKIALRNLEKLSSTVGIPIYPIIGVGSAPFRGNLRPDNVERVLCEYRSAHTFTLQSAFKYDNPVNEVESAIDRIKAFNPQKAQEIDEKRALDIVGRYSKEYQKQIVGLAPIINAVAKYVPGRRQRKLHIGLFGYARNMGGVTLPRVITFTCALYSIGLPPEILALNALTKDDIDFIRSVYSGFDQDIKDALKFYNKNSQFVPQPVKEAVEEMFDYETNGAYVSMSEHVGKSIIKNNTEHIAEQVLMQANMRRFLG